MYIHVWTSEHGRFINYSKSEARAPKHCLVRGFEWGVELIQLANVNLRQVILHPIAYLLILGMLQQTPHAYLTNERIPHYQP